MHPMNLSSNKRLFDRRGQKAMTSDYVCFLAIIVTPLDRLSITHYSINLTHLLNYFLPKIRPLLPLELDSNKKLRKCRICWLSD
jgi:hypothetical protein